MLACSCSSDCSSAHDHKARATRNDHIDTTAKRFMSISRRWKVLTSAPAHIARAVWYLIDESPVDDCRPQGLRFLYSPQATTCTLRGRLRSRLPTAQLPRCLGCRRP